MKQNTNQDLRWWHSVGSNDVVSKLSLKKNGNKNKKGIKSINVIINQTEKSIKAIIKPESQSMHNQSNRKVNQSNNKWNRRLNQCNNKWNRKLNQCNNKSNRKFNQCNSQWNRKFNQCNIMMEMSITAGCLFSYLSLFLITLDDSTERHCDPR